MLKVYNKTALTRHERFTKALLFGGAAALAAIAIDAILLKVFNVFFPVIYIGFGYGIGYAIQYFGHGVQIRFSILAAVLTAVTMLTCDLIAYPPNVLLSELTAYGIDSLLMWGYRAVGLYLAWRYARII